MNIDQYTRLGFDEAKRREEFFNNCSRHIDHAREKHPFFCSAVGRYSYDFSHHALVYKERIASEPTLKNVLLSEVYECLDAFFKGDTEHALEEACDVVAVLYRACAGDMDEKGGAQ